MSFICNLIICKLQRGRSSGKNLTGSGVNGFKKIPSRDWQAWKKQIFDYSNFFGYGNFFHPWDKIAFVSKNRFFHAHQLREGIFKIHNVFLNFFALPSASLQFNTLGCRRTRYLPKNTFPTSILNTLNCFISERLV